MSGVCSKIQTVGASITVNAAAVSTIASRAFALTAPLGFEGTYYPEGMEGVPRRLAIVRANRYMVAHSDCLIAYVRHPASNARELLEYAQAREQGLNKNHSDINCRLYLNISSKRMAFSPKR